jgi:hypothetical protein
MQNKASLGSVYIQTNLAGFHIGFAKEHAIQVLQIFILAIATLIQI